MKPLFLAGLVVGLIFVVLGVLYLIPDVPHPLTSSSPHLKHAVAAFAVAIAAVLGGRFASNAA